MSRTSPRRTRSLVALLATVVVAATATLINPTAAGAAIEPHGDDTVLVFGNARFYGSTQGRPLAAPLIGSAPTPSGRGYWLVAADGGVFAYGDAKFYGSTGGIRLNSPVISMAGTPSGRGYWMVAADGGVFSFGDAKFFGSTGGIRLNSPVIAMTPTPTGNGYWLLARDGGVFSFGDAKFYGSTGGLRLNSPVVGMASTPHGTGYWLVARDGGIFSFGSAAFYGSTGGMRLNKPIVGMAARNTGRGYWLAASDGGVFAFGDAPFVGSGAGHVSSIDQVIQITPVPHFTGYRMLVAPLPFNTPLLSPGAAGPAVASLQQHLLDLGYWIDGVSGSYGLTTTQAVYAFQKVEGLPRSGIVDIQTSQRLKNARRPKPASTTGYLIEVDKAHQVIKIALNGTTAWVINTSTGSEIPYVHDGQTFTAKTPEGHFNVLRQINGLDISPLGELWRPKYFTNTGIAFHGSPSIPPHPASHGCVRMTNAAIDFIWANNLIPIGTAVWVY